jgi:hypothetical protein
MIVSSVPRKATACVAQESMHGQRRRRKSPAQGDPQANGVLSQNGCGLFDRVVHFIDVS